MQDYGDHMSESKSIPTGSAWLAPMFETNAAKDGGLTRRAIADVEKYASLDLLKKQVKERGFILFKSGGQYVVLCQPNLEIVPT